MRKWARRIEEHPTALMTYYKGRNIPLVVFSFKILNSTVYSVGWSVASPDAEWEDTKHFYTREGAIKRASSLGRFAALARTETGRHPG
jgi:hypothetical protein